MGTALWRGRASVEMRYIGRRTWVQGDVVGRVAAG